MAAEIQTHRQWVEAGLALGIGSAVAWPLGIVIAGTAAAGATGVGAIAISGLVRSGTMMESGRARLHHHRYRSRLEITTKRRMDLVQHAPKSDLQRTLKR